MNLQILQEFLDKSNIPVYKKPPKTFLEIIRKKHHEVIISNLYAFYFNINEEHGLNDLFILSLIECIEETNLGKEKSFDGYADFTIDTEYSTKNNGRIDLLLTGENGAIIIENKIYHHLNNNLKDYWDTVIKNNNEVESTIGIVLSLKKVTKIKNPHFINITHNQLLDKVMSNIGQYLLSANEKYLIFLKDFYQNIKNLSRKIMKEEDFKFYFDNEDKIRDLNKLSSLVVKHIKSEVEKACFELDEFSILNFRKNSIAEQKRRLYQYKKDKNLYFRIVFSGLLPKAGKSEQILAIWIEHRKDAMKNREDFKNLIEGNVLSEEEKELLYDEFFTKDLKGTNNLYFAKKTYQINEDQLYNLSDFIVEKIENDGFLFLIEKIAKFNKTRTF